MFAKNLISKVKTLIGNVYEIDVNGIYPCFDSYIKHAKLTIYQSLSIFIYTREKEEKLTRARPRERERMGEEKLQLASFV